MRTLSYFDLETKYYRNVEAMSLRGLTVDEIARNLGITKMNVLDILQKMHYNTRRKENKRRREQNEYRNRECYRKI